MTKIKNNKVYDLEDRTFLFADRVIKLCKTIPENVIAVKLISQLIRSSGSVGANYREANDALSKKDFLLRIKISRKECKETTYWLTLIKNETDHQEIDRLIEESKELRNIFTAILEKSKAGAV